MPGLAIDEQVLFLHQVDQTLGNHDPGIMEMPYSAAPGVKYLFFEFLFINGHTIQEEIN
jgi:hypothetical protein